MHYFGTLIKAVKNTRVHLIIVSFPSQIWGKDCRVPKRVSDHSTLRVSCNLRIGWRVLNLDTPSYTDTKFYRWLYFSFGDSTRFRAMDSTYGASRSHSLDTAHLSDSSGRVIGPTKRPLPDNTQHSQQTDIHAPGEIRNHNPSKRAAVDLRLRLCGHWDRPDDLQPYFSVIINKAQNYSWQRKRRIYWGVRWRKT